MPGRVDYRVDVLKRAIRYDTRKNGHTESLKVDFAFIHGRENIYERPGPLDRAQLHTSPYAQFAINTRRVKLVACQTANLRRTHGGPTGNAPGAVSMKYGLMVFPRTK